MYLYGTSLAKFASRITKHVNAAVVNISLVLFQYFVWRHSGLMVNVLTSSLSCPGSSLGQGHCVVFLSETLYSHSASLHPGVQIHVGVGKFNVWANPAMD